MNTKFLAALFSTLFALGASSAAAAPTYPPIPAPGVQMKVVVSFGNASASLVPRFVTKLSNLQLNKESVITITGYVSKTSNSKADFALGLQRAKNTQKTLLKFAPKNKYIILSKGSTFNAACKLFKNRCSIITIKS